MIIGVLGHAARFAVFAFFADSVPVIVAVQLLHGVCYAFFFATVYIFVDAVFPKDVRSSAQGLFNLLILGVGNVVASFLFPTADRPAHAPNGAVDYQQPVPGPDRHGAGRPCCCWPCSSARPSRGRARPTSGPHRTASPAQP